MILELSPILSISLITNYEHFFSDVKPALLKASLKNSDQITNFPEYAALTKALMDSYVQTGFNVGLATKFMRKGTDSDSVYQSAIKVI